MLEELLKSISKNCTISVEDGESVIDLIMDDKDSMDRILVTGDLYYFKNNILCEIVKEPMDIILRYGYYSEKELSIFINKEDLYLWIKAIERIKGMLLLREKNREEIILKVNNLSAEYKDELLKELIAVIYK